MEKVKTKIKINNMFERARARQMPKFFVVMLVALFLIAGQMHGASAVTVTNDIEGKLVKGGLPEVYFVGVDNKRYVFPNERVFFSWYNDFSSVQTITDEALAALTIGGNVTYKPGTRLIKIESDPKVYAVGAGGLLRWVSSEDIAKQLFGDNWAKQVDDVDVSNFSTYKSGDPINASTDFNPTNEQSTGATIGGVKVPERVTSKPKGGDNVSTPFKIISVDSSAGEVEGTIIVKMVFNRPPTGARLTIVEKVGNKAFYNEPVIRTASTATEVSVKIGSATRPFKASTTYSWKLVAYAAPNATANQIASASGEFATGNKKTATDDDALFKKIKIVSVKVTSVDGDGKTSETSRTFTVEAEGALKDADWEIKEKGSGEVLEKDTLILLKSPFVFSLSPKSALKSKTTYQWSIKLHSAFNMDIATATGEFTTGDFSSVMTPDALAYFYCPVEGNDLSQGCCVSGGSFVKASAQLSAGTLIRGESSSMVYYYAANGKRYVMTGKDVMNSWFASSSDLLSSSVNICANVRQIADSQLSAISLGGNVGIRPGTYLVKIDSSPKIYVVSHGRLLRGLASNELAEKIFPNSATARLKVVPDAYFTGYAQGADISSEADYNAISEYNTTIEKELGIN